MQFLITKSKGKQTEGSRGLCHEAQRAMLGTAAIFDPAEVTCHDDIN